MAEEVHLALPKRPPQVVHDSLSALYGYFLDLFVKASPISSKCGCVVHCYEHHFVHMVKLAEAVRDREAIGDEEGELVAIHAEAGEEMRDPQRIYFPHHQEKIVATTTGFGDYIHDGARARSLATALICLQEPDLVVRSAKLRNADRAFIKRFDDTGPYPYTVVLVGTDGNQKRLYTGFSVNKRQIKKYEEGEQLFPPKTPQPPAKVAV